MAKEMFELYDEDNDGYLTLFDFRTAQAVKNGYTSLIHEHEYCNLESWKMFMKDHDFELNARGILTISLSHNFRIVFLLT